MTVRPEVKIQVVDAAPGEAEPARPRNNTGLELLRIDAETGMPAARCRLVGGPPESIDGG